MRMKPIELSLAAGWILWSVIPAGAANLDGTVKVGGVILDEVGDESTVQETYNIYDGFNLTQIRLGGTLNPRNYFMLDLRDLTLDSRKGDLVYRMPGTFKLTAGYDQHRQVFDPARAVTSDRKDWKFGAQYTPEKWLNLNGSLNVLNRGGDRLSFPPGTAGVLGTSYDNSLVSGQVAAEVRKDGTGGGLSYRISDYSDQRNPAADRMGHVVSARFYAPSFLLDKMTHMLRGAYGVRKLSNGDLEYTLADFQYTGVVEPVKAFQFKYNFDATRIDNESTRLKTDRFQNNFDAEYRYKYGRLAAGYGYEMNDDDRSLTSYNSWNAGTTFIYGKVLSATVDYMSRTKKDQEELTLLKDLEASRIRAKLDVHPWSDVTLGGGYVNREREFPDISVEAEGEVTNAFGRYTLTGWGSISADYAYTSERYVDLAAGFDTDSHVVTGRLEIERIRNLRLAGGATYLDIGKDLDIEKSMIFVEGAYTFRRDYHLEVKYNVYNYDDYILLDRYYTANVVWINVAYDLHFE